MREISFQKALEEAVAEEMRRDPRVITMATDFTGDPIKEFGPARVRFTPISEAVLTGMGLGAAGCGFRPIVNWRMVTFSFVAMDQIVNQASKIRYMFGGQADFPVTYRCTHRGRHRPRRPALAEPVLDVDAPRRASRSSSRRRRPTPRACSRAPSATTIPWSPSSAAGSPR